MRKIYKFCALILLVTLAPALTDSMYAADLFNPQNIEEQNIDHRIVIPDPLPTTIRRENEEALELYRQEFNETQRELRLDAVLCENYHWQEATGDNSEPEMIEGCFEEPEEEEEPDPGCPGNMYPEDDTCYCYTGYMPVDSDPLSEPGLGCEGCEPDWNARYSSRPPCPLNCGRGSSYQHKTNSCT